jgi:cytochrome c oxidase subunit IV
VNPPPVRTYVATWAALMLLLALSCASAFVPLGAFNSIVNFAVAAAKALLVAVFFMHLLHASSLTRIFAAVALFMLALLFGLSSADYATRHIVPAPWAAPASK